MTLDDIHEELANIKRELERLETRGTPTKQTESLRDRIDAMEKHIGIKKNMTA